VFDIALYSVDIIVMYLLIAGLFGYLFDIISGTLTAKRHPASSKVTAEAPKIGTGTAVQTKLPLSADGKSSMKKTTEKQDDVKKPPAKKYPLKSDGLLAFILFVAQQIRQWTYMWP